MSLNLEITGVKGRSGPGRALIFSCRWKWQDQTAFILGISGTLECHGEIVSNHLMPDEIIWPGNNSTPVVENGREFTGTVVVPLSREALSFIERKRNGDVSFHLKCRYQYQYYLTWTEGKGQGTAIGGQIGWNTSGRNHTIPQSEWQKRLKELGWEELQLFEVPMLPLVSDKNLEHALAALTEAESALRGHDHKGVLVKCREALESAAKYESAGDTKRGFELLVARAFPDHESKRVAVSALIQKLSEYAHTLGRHAQYPAVNVTRAEAEFALATTVSLFSLISRRLAGKESL